MNEDENGPGTSGCRTFQVCDRRTGKVQDKMITFLKGSAFNDLKEGIRKECGIGSEVDFEITNSRRESLRVYSTFSELQNGDTLIVLESLEQEFSTPVKRKINIEPHYNTIVKSGQYDYYMSEGCDPLPYALAELIDNSLSATANNIGPRKIEVRLYLEGSSPKNWMVCVLDNGKGMTANELNDWAVLRRSKFDAKRHAQYSRKQMGEQHERRFLNSDISFFGVGGKQACFFMGESVTVFSKATSSVDVCEVTIAKEKFEKREKSGKQIFHEDLEQRRPGDASSHSDIKNLVELIAEEEGKDSFTHVLITGTRPENFRRVRKNMLPLCTELANVYHYYIHGWTGNTAVKRENVSETDDSTWMAEHHSVEISVTSYRNGMEHRCMKLHEIQDDFQSQFIGAAADTFEFQITVPMKLKDDDPNQLIKEEGKIEGVLRYHPFLFTTETYPVKLNENVNEEETTGLAQAAPRIGDPSKPARGNQPIFSCYWNGRLVPYTTIKEFSWCSPKKTERAIPLECYNRLSGVLFTNDVFKVSTNKLTFLDLEEKVAGKDVMFKPKTGEGQFRRGTIEQSFREWLTRCHKELDKQVIFIEPTENINMHSRMWTRFKAIFWDGRTFSKDQLVRRRTKTTINHGRVHSFLLEGEYKENVCSSGGMFGIKLEPEAVYQGEMEWYPLKELDRTATEEEMNRRLGMEEGKLPQYVLHQWLDDRNMKPGENGKWTLQSGKDIGGFRASIRTSDGTDVSRMPSKGKAVKPLAVTAQLIKKSNKKGEEGECLLSIDNTSHIKDEGFVFKSLAVKHFPLGEYILRLAVTMKSTAQDASVAYTLPVTDIELTIIGGPATRFDIGHIPSSIRIREPFPVTLKLTDDMNNPTVPPQDMQPILTCTFGKEKKMLEVKSGHFHWEGDSLVSRDVTLTGNMGASKSAKPMKAKLTIAMPQLINQKKPRIWGISVEPGKPSKLRVPFFDGEPCHQNGKALKIEVQIEDEDGNPTSGENMDIACKFGGDKDVAIEYHGTPSSDGRVTLTGKRITLHNLQGPKEITAVVFTKNPGVDRVNGKIRIEPRKGPAKFLVFDEDGNKIGNEEEITRTAGKHIDSFGFKLLDEAGRDIEVDQTLASRMYFGGKSYPELFMSGKLPPIQLEKKVDMRPTNYRLHLRKEEVEFSFNIRSVPGPAASIRDLSWESGHISLQCGDPLDVTVEITDEYGNCVDAKELPEAEAAEFFLEAGDGKPLSCEQFLIRNEAGVVFSDVQYPKIATAAFECSVHYKGSKTTFTVNIAPGPPAQLMVLNDDEEISTFRGVALKRDVTFRLLDQYGNVISEPKYNVALKSSSDDVKILADSLVCGKHDSLTGDYIFVGLALDGPLGVHHIIGEAQLNDRQIQSKPIEIKILPDPDRPHNVKVDFVKQEKYEAGACLPRCEVIAFAENGTAIPLHREDVTAEIKTSHGDVLTRHADFAKKGKCIFSSMTAPPTTGTYSLMFYVRHGEDERLSSDEVLIHVVPGPPAKLMPVADLPVEPQVSSTYHHAKRRIMSATTFSLVDEHGNFVDANIRGTMRLEISGRGQKTVPLLEGKTEHQIVKSLVKIPAVNIKKGCPGVNATRYTLSFTPVLPDHDVKPYEYSFTFYNDVDQQEKNMTLIQEKSELQEKITVFDKEYESLKADKKGIQGMMQQERMEGKKLLQSAGRQFVNLHTRAEIEQKRREMEEAVQTPHLPRRACRIPVYPKQDSDILGKVAHLARVQDEREAKVLSWHLSSAMDCVVTTTMQKAEEIMNETNGEQGLLILDKPFTPKDWEKPLPHEHNQFMGEQDKVPGNVVYAKHLLKFNVHEEKCKQVFHQLLGDSIIVDSMQDALAYRQMVVDCPTIFTRDGDRLSEDGTFCGSLNRCPDDLSGRMFSQPEHSDRLQTIDFLRKAEGVFLRVGNLQTKLDKMITALESDTIRAVIEEVDAARVRVQEIESSLPKEYRKRKRSPSPPSLCPRASRRTRRARCGRTDLADQQDEGATTAVAEEKGETMPSLCSRVSRRTRRARCGRTDLADQQDEGATTAAAEEEGETTPSLCPRGSRRTRRARCGRTDLADQQDEGATTAAAEEKGETPPSLCPRASRRTRRARCGGTDLADQQDEGATTAAAEEEGETTTVSADQLDQGEMTATAEEGETTTASADQHDERATTATLEERETTTASADKYDEEYPKRKRSPSPPHRRASRRIRRTGSGGTASADQQDQGATSAAVEEGETTTVSVDRQDQGEMKATVGEGETTTVSADQRDQGNTTAAAEEEGETTVSADQLDQGEMTATAEEGETTTVSADQHDQEEMTATVGNGETAAFSADQRDQGEMAARVGEGETAAFPVNQRDQGEMNSADEYDEGETTSDSEDEFDKELMAAAANKGEKTSASAGEYVEGETTSVSADEMDADETIVIPDDGETTSASEDEYDKEETTAAADVGQSRVARMWNSLSGWFKL